MTILVDAWAIVVSLLADPVLQAAVCATEMADGVVFLVGLEVGRS